MFLIEFMAGSLIQRCASSRLGSMRWWDHGASLPDRAAGFVTRFVGRRLGIFKLSLALAPTKIDVLQARTASRASASPMETVMAGLGLAIEQRGKAAASSARFGFALIQEAFSIQGRT